jgi:hypothetical protein
LTDPPDHDDAAFHQGTVSWLQALLNEFVTASLVTTPKVRVVTDLSPHFNYIRDAYESRKENIPEENLWHNNRIQFLLSVYFNLPLEIWGENNHLRFWHDSYTEALLDDLEDVSDPQGGKKLSEIPNIFYFDGTGRLPEIAFRCELERKIQFHQLMIMSWRFDGRYKISRFCNPIFDLSGPRPYFHPKDVEALKIRVKNDYRAWVPWMEKNLEDLRLGPIFEKDPSNFYESFLRESLSNESQTATNNRNGKEKAPRILLPPGRTEPNSGDRDESVARGVQDLVSQPHRSPPQAATQAGPSTLPATQSQAHKVQPPMSQRATNNTKAVDPNNVTLKDLGLVRGQYVEKKDKEGGFAKHPGKFPNWNFIMYALLYRYPPNRMTKQNLYNLAIAWVVGLEENDSTCRHGLTCGETFRNHKRQRTKGSSPGDWWGISTNKEIEDKRREREKKRAAKAAAAEEQAEADKDKDKESDENAENSTGHKTHGAKRRRHHSSENDEARDDAPARSSTSSASDEGAELLDAEVPNVLTGVAQSQEKEEERLEEEARRTSKRLKKAR